MNEEQHVYDQVTSKCNKMHTYSYTCFKNFIKCKAVFNFKTNQAANALIVCILMISANTNSLPIVSAFIV